MHPGPGVGLNNSFTTIDSVQMVQSIDSTLTTIMNNAPANNPGAFVFVTVTGTDSPAGTPEAQTSIQDEEQITRAGVGDVSTVPQVGTTHTYVPGYGWVGTSPHKP